MTVPPQPDVSMLPESIIMECDDTHTVQVGTAIGAHDPANLSALQRCHM